MKDNNKLVMMSDREKGLKKAIATVFPDAVQSHYYQHIAANIQSRFDIKAREAFWPMAYARTRAQYDKALTDLIKLNPAAGEYYSKSFLIIIIKVF